MCNFCPWWNSKWPVTLHIQYFCQWGTWQWKIRRAKCSHRGASPIATRLHNEFCWKSPGTPRRSNCRRSWASQQRLSTLDPSARNFLGNLRWWQSSTFRSLRWWLAQRSRCFLFYCWLFWNSPGSGLLFCHRKWFTDSKSKRQLKKNLNRSLHPDSNSPQVAPFNICKIRPYPI